MGEMRSLVRVAGGVACALALASWSGGCATPRVEPEALLEAASAPEMARFVETNNGLGRPIRVAIVTWGGYTGGLYANGGLETTAESLYATKYNLDIEFVVVDDYPLTRDAFKAGGDVAGGVDIMWGTVDSYALEYDTLSAYDPKVVLQYDWSRGGDAVVATREIGRVSDLKGKKIALAQMTPSHFFLLFMLEQAGLTASDVNLVYMASAVEAAALFEQGRVDAAVSWSPDVYMVAEAVEGSHLLVSTHEARALIADVFIARGDFVSEHPELLEAFSRGWFEGTDVVRSAPEEHSALVAGVFEGVDLAAARLMHSDVMLTTGADNRAFFGIAGDTSLRTYEVLFEEARRLWARPFAGVDPESTRATTHMKWLGKSTQARSSGGDGPATLWGMRVQVRRGEVIVTRSVEAEFSGGEPTPGARDALHEVALLAEVFGSSRLRVRCASVDGAQGPCVGHEAALASHLTATYGIPSERLVTTGSVAKGRVEGSASFTVEVLR